MATLLVVDDDTDIRELVVRRLVQQGHEVLSADGGPSALALLRHHALPDAAILDIDMAVIDGFELLTRLRVRQPDLPAMFLTVLWHDHAHARIRTAGASYLAKRFTAAELNAAVQPLLARDDVDAGLGRGP